MALRSRLWHFMLFSLPHQHRAAVYVEYFSGDKASLWCAQEKDRRGDFFGRAYTTQRDARANLRAGIRIVERVGGHVGVDPSGSHAVGADAVAREFARKRFRH